MSERDPHAVSSLELGFLGLMEVDPPVSPRLPSPRLLMVLPVSSNLSRRKWKKTKFVVGKEARKKDTDWGDVFAPRGEGNFFLQPDKSKEGHTKNDAKDKGGGMAVCGTTRQRCMDRVQMDFGRFFTPPPDATWPENLRFSTLWKHKTSLLLHPQSSRR